MMIAKMLIEHLEDRQFGCGHRLIIHKLHRAQRAQLHLELRRPDPLLRRLALGKLGDSLDIEIEYIEKDPA
jgi:hypothetical protein